MHTMIISETDIRVGYSNNGKFRTLIMFSRECWIDAIAMINILNGGTEDIKKTFEDNVVFNSLELLEGNEVIL